MDASAGFEITPWALPLTENVTFQSRREEYLEDIIIVTPKKGQEAQFLTIVSALTAE